jgi:ABC-type amino acid transport substrate-binding protein
LIHGHSSFHITLIFQVVILLLSALIPAISFNPEFLPLKVGLYDNAPYAFLDEGGHPRGFDIEILNKVAAHEGWWLEYVYDELTVLLEKSRRGEIDLITTTTHTDERDSYLDFVKPEFFSNWGAVSALGKSNIFSVADLDGKAVAVLKNDRIAEDFKQHCLRNLVKPIFREAETYAEVFKLVESREVLGGISSNIYALRHAKDFNAQMVPIEFAPSHSMIAFPEGRHKKISKALSNLLWRWKRDKSSNYYHLYDQWFSREKLIDLTYEEQNWLNKHLVIRVALMSEHPPYHFFDDSGKISGLTADFFELFEKDLGIKIEAVARVNQKETLDMLSNKEIDVIPSLSSWHEYEKNILFSDSFLHSNYAIVARRGDTTIQSEVDISGKKVALINSFAGNSEWFRKYPDLNYSYVTTPSEALLQVSEGKADAAVLSPETSAYLIKHNEIADLEIKTVLQWGGNKWSIGVRKDWPEFVSILNKELKATPENKKVTIFNKWVSPESPH